MRFSLIFYLLLFITSIEFLSCKNSDKKTEDFNSKDLKIDKNNFPIRNDPEKYKEEITDTIIHGDNNYTIVIKKYTLMNSYVILKLDDEEIHFRDYAVNIKIFKSDSLLKSVTYQKQDFKEQFGEGFEEQATITNCWFDKYDTQQEELVLNLSICAEDTDWCYMYKLYFDTKGNVRYELEEVT